MGKQTIFVLLGALCLLGSCGGEQPAPGPTPTPDPGTHDFYYITSVKSDGYELFNFIYSNDFKSCDRIFDKNDTETIELNDDYQILSSHHTVTDIGINNYDLYEYNSDGTLAKYREYDGGLEESNLDEGIDFTYENGKLVLEEYYDFANGIEHPTNKHVHTYSNNVEEIIYYYHDGTDFAFSYADRIVTTSDENTYTIQYFRKEYIDQEFFENYREVYDTKTNQQIYYLSCTDHFFYKYDLNVNGDTVEEFMGYIVDNEERLDGHIVFSYNEKNYLSDSIYYSYEDGVPVEYEKAHYEFNEDGAVTKETISRYDDYSLSWYDHEYEYELVKFNQYIDAYVETGSLAYQPGFYTKY